MLKFKNGKFRIMQVSDPQDLQYIRPTMVRMLNMAYDSLKPDLIVLTGDNILSKYQQIDAIQFAQMMEEIGIFKPLSSEYNNSIRIYLSPA